MARKVNGKRYPIGSKQMYFCFNHDCAKVVFGEQYMIDNQVYCKKCYNKIQRKEKLNKINESR